MRLKKMKYEVMLKIKEYRNSSFETKYRVVADSEIRMNLIKIQYLEIGQKRSAEWFDYVVLVNKLDDDGNFIETVC